MCFFLTIISSITYNETIDKRERERECLSFNTRQP